MPFSYDRRRNQKSLRLFVYKKCYDDLLLLQNVTSLLFKYLQGKRIENVYLKSISCLVFFIVYNKQKKVMMR
jgi:hypothetical protein